MYLTGVLQAFGIVVITTLFNVYIRVNSLLFDIEPIVFACTYLLATALTLSLVAGPGKYVSDTLKTPATWIYGFILVCTFTVDIYLVRYISGTEVSVLSRIAVPISMVLAALFLARLPQKEDIINILCLTLSVAVIFLLQDHETLYPVAILGFLSALFQAATFFLSETHKQSVVAQKIGNLKDRARVVGFVTFVTSMMFLFVALIVAAIKDFYFPTQLSFLPSLSQFAHAPTIWAGFFFGLMLSPFTRYFQWSATYKIKTENVLTILAIIPLTTLGCEWLLSFHPLFADNAAAFEGSRGKTLLGISLLMAFGAMVSAYLRLTKNVDFSHHGSFKEAVRAALAVDKSDLTIQHAAHALDDYEIINATLEYTGDQQEKAANLLDISVATLNVVKNGKGTLALVPEVSRQVARRYRKHVASCDALTGLLGRSGFAQQAKELLAKTKTATLIYIDLDKFKPVNDTYGHDIGDAVLTLVATRLKQNLPAKAIIGRLGGDEFAALVPGKTAAELAETTTTLQQKLCDHYAVEGETVTIGASLGLATCPDVGSEIETLMKAADDAMYQQKQQRKY